MIRVLPPHPTRYIAVRLVMWDKMWEGFGHGKAVRNECEGHFAAMSYDKVPTFLRRLRERESFSRLALQFAILTAGRSGEVREATWDEIDLEAKLWTIPKDRMKAQREHVEPLGEGALKILRRCEELRLGAATLLFPGARPKSPLSDMTLTKLLREMREPYTAHGFRSSFRDCVSEETQHSGDVAEAALAHVVKSKTEAAYRRGNLLEKCRAMMGDWDAFCGGLNPKVDRGVIQKARNDPLRQTSPGRLM